MGKKTVSPFVGIAQALGKDVGDIKNILVSIQDNLEGRKELIQSNGSDPLPVPSDVAPIRLQGLSDESGMMLLLNYNVEPQSSGKAIENYGLPIPEEFTPYQGWCFVKQNGHWECVSDIHLGEPILIENGDPCEVLIIAKTQSIEKKTIIATEVNV